jgi:hypothetical protein
LVIFAHDPEYVAQLGRCVYSFLSVEWIVVDLILRYGNDKVRKMAPFGSGQIATGFAEAMRDRDDPMGLASRYQDVVRRRNDILHARPATIEGKQRLFRWDPRRGELGPVTDDTLAGFLGDLERLARDLETERTSAREMSR